MTHVEISRRLVWVLRATPMVLLIVLLSCGFFSSLADASFEQLPADEGVFGGTVVLPTPPGNFPENAQLGGASGMAVNATGAGEVPAGTVYVAEVDPEHPEGPVRIVRFGPDGVFRMVWTTPSERCGTPESLPACQPHAISGRGAVDVDVDQTTGNVYAFNSGKNSTGAKEIQVFDAAGTKLITEFGEHTNDQTIAESPGKLHGGSAPGGIAVDASGTVYVFDAEPAIGLGAHHYRLMVFRPQTPGDYEHYVYAGESQDVDPGAIEAGKEGKAPTRPVVDDAGDIYVAGEGYIQKFDPTQPTAPPLCTFIVKDSGIHGMNVNQKTGEVFFYDYKDRKIHQLSPCTAGAFTEIASFTPLPPRGYIESLAVNPSLSFEPGGESGVVYGATAEATGAAGGGEPGQSALGYIFAEHADHEPIIESESVSQVAITSATLKAQINPKGAQTTYFFEYLTDAQYQANEPADRFAGASKAPIGGAALGSGTASLAAAVTVSGLQPNTEYHYRAVAANSEGTAMGAGQTFRTFPFTLGLPDNRAYELVSPAEKDGGEVFPIDPTRSSCRPLGECKPAGQAAFPQQSASDGNAVVYEGSSFSFGGGAVLENQYISRRTDSGWQTTTLSPQTLAGGERQGYQAFTSALTEGLVYQGFPTLSSIAPSGYYNLYKQSTGTPSLFTPLIGQTRHERPEGASMKLTYAGASADFSRIFFEANDALTEEEPGVAPAAEDGGLEKNNLYEWHAGQLHLVNVLPGNAEAPAGAAFGQAATISSISVLANAISDDGSSAFWSSESGQVYVRIDGRETREIADPGKFLAASADGSRVLLEDGCLYDIAEARCEDLTASQGGFLGVVGHSEDLSHIYFVDTKSLTGANAEGKVPNEKGAGEANLYAWDEGSLDFVTTLLSADGPGGGSKQNDWSPPAPWRTAEASPDGRWLAFQSKGRQTGYDNAGPCGPEQVSGACTEVFLYNSVSKRLACASCNPTNERPLGESVVPLISFPGGWIPQPRYLLNSGRLFFDSRDSLAPGDTNGGVEDVYEYEPQGVPTGFAGCQVTGGCISLISAGTGTVDSNFHSTDETGANVFFTTRDQLTPRDHDELIDLYDARENGGILAEAEIPPVECQAEACQPSQPAPSEQLPNSSAAGPADNVKPKSCKKGQVRRGERCVAKRKKDKHKKHRHKNHPRSGQKAKHKRGGAK